jgi:hypothetical protein
MEPWQTRASEFHPYLIATLDELPAALQAQVAGALQHGETLASGCSCLRTIAPRARTAPSR